MGGPETARPRYNNPICANSLTKAAAAEHKFRTVIVVKFSRFSVVVHYDLCGCLPCLYFVLHHSRPLRTDSGMDDEGVVGDEKWEKDRGLFCSSCAD